MIGRCRGHGKQARNKCCPPANSWHDIVTGEPIGMGRREDGSMAGNSERMKHAIEILDGAGNLRERLSGAYRSELQYLGPEGLTEEQARELERINDELTSVDAEGDKDTIDMSVQNMADFELQDIVDRIHGLYESIGKAGLRPCG
jgi:hypothetical protein